MVAVCAVHGEAEAKEEALHGRDTPMMDAGSLDAAAAAAAAAGSDSPVVFKHKSK